LRVTEQQTDLKNYATDQRVFKNCFRLPALLAWRRSCRKITALDVPESRFFCNEFSEESFKNPLPQNFPTSKAWLNCILKYQLVAALSYKLEGRGFDSRCCRNFLL